MKSTTMSSSCRSVWLAALLVGALTGAQAAIAQAGTTAVRELGQPDFVHSASNTVDGQTLSLSFAHAGVSVDTSVSPNHLYVADPGNNRVLGYTSVAALVNGGAATLVIGQPDLFASTANNGGTTASSLNGPRGVAVDASGNVYVADTSNNRVLVFSNPFTILANTGQNSGFTATAVLGQGGDFSASSCNVGASTPSADTLCAPESVALDGSSNLYLADTSNNRVLEYNAPVNSSTFAANIVFGQFGSFTTNTANNSGTSKDSLNAPSGVAIDKNNNLYVADNSNNRVLEYNTPLTVTGIAGSGDTSADQVWGQGGSFGTNTCNGGATLSATTLCLPVKVALDASANLYVADGNNNRILEYNEGANPPTNRTANIVLGQTNTTTGTCNQGGGAIPSASTLCAPSAAALDTAGDLFVADSTNNRVVKYNTPLSTNESASVEVGQADLIHSGTNLTDAASLSGPKQIAIDASASPNRIFVADTANNRVLGYRNAATFVNNAPADLVIGEPDFNSTIGGATASRLSQPQGVAVDANGNLYVADTSNSRVLEFTAPFAGCSGTFPCVGGSANKVFGQTTFTASTCNIDGSTVNANSLCLPQRVAVDSLGNLYVGDSSNNRVLEYNTPLSATTTGSNDTTADLVFGQGATGKGTEFTTNDANHPTNTVSANSLFTPTGVALDPNNNLYVADLNNSRVLEYAETVNASTAPANVTANNVFGQLGSTSSKLCNNVAESADSLCNPADVSVDASSNVYISDRSNNRDLLYLTPLISGTTASVVWGQGGNFATNFANVGGTSPSAGTLSTPNGVANDSAGNLYIADSSNNRVTAYSPPFPPPGLEIVPPPSPGVLSVPTQMRFKPTKLGRRRSRSLVVKNTGPVPVRILNISGGPEFNYVSSCGLIVAAGQSCTIQVTFAPITIGHRGDALVISDDARNSPHVVDLQGRAERRRARQ